MSYYGRGDYYRGDYYRGGRGDPGLMKALGKIGGAVAGFVTGGPAGAVAGHSAGGRIGGALEGRKPVPQLQAPTGGLIGGALGALDRAAASMGVPPGLIQGTNALFFGPPSSMAGGCPSGFHLDKRTRSRCVRNRSMNVLNPRALSRSLRRAEGFEKIATREGIQLLEVGSERGVEATRPAPHSVRRAR